MLFLFSGTLFDALYGEGGKTQASTKRGLNRSRLAMMHDNNNKTGDNHEKDDDNGSNGRFGNWSFST